MDRFLVLLLVFVVFLAPWWLTPLRNAKWPLRAKQAIALSLMGLFTLLVTRALVGEAGGNPYLVAGAKVFLLGYFLLGLFTAYNAWPREERVERVTDIRRRLAEAIEATEERLGLSSLERLEKLNPREGTFSHTLVRYTDGSWLEWLNPTDEKGEPDFSYFTVYSNNQQIVAFLSDLVGQYCNVERTKEPLWREKQ